VKQCSLPDAPAAISHEYFSLFDPRLTAGRWIQVVNRLREQRDVFETAQEAGGFHVLTKYADIGLACQRTDLYSNCPILPRSPSVAIPWRPVTADRSQHLFLRGVLGRRLSPKVLATRSEAYRDLLMPILTLHLPKGASDLTRDVCFPFSLAVITDALGIPSGTELANLLLRATSTVATEDAAISYCDATDEVRRHFRELIAARHRSRNDGLATILRMPGADGRPLFTTDEAMDCLMLIVGDGVSSTAYS
jgi:cytochrome P450